ncbi:MAG: hypothetical protein ACT4QD_20090 [Acidobacteriota bacterium]
MTGAWVLLALTAGVAGQQDPPSSPDRLIIRAGRLNGGESTSAGPT